MAPIKGVLGTWEWDITHDLIYFSPNLLKILGFKESVTFKSDEWMARVHPDDVLIFKKQINLCINGSESFFEATYRVQDFQGSWRKILDKGCVISWKKNGTAEIITGTKIDVTFQKAINFIKEQQDQLNQEIGLINLNENIDKAERDPFHYSLKAILRLTESEFGFIGRFVGGEKEKFYNIKFFGSKHSGVQANRSEKVYKLTSCLDASFQSNKPFICNNPARNSFVFPDIHGATFLKNYMIIPIYSGYKLVAIVGIANRLEEYNEQTIVKLIQPAIDALSNLIQDNHQQFEAVSEQDLLKLFVKYTPLAVTMLDSDFCYLAVSDTWLRLYNLEGKDLIGTPLAQLSGNHVPQKVFERFKLCLQGEIIKNKEDHIVRPDGTMMWLKWEAHPWYKEDGAAGGIIIFNEDITENKAIEFKMKKMVAELSRSNHELERFAYGCCHDMNEPLRGMASMAHLIIKHNSGRLDETTQEYLQYIIKGANRLQRLIQDILIYSQVGIEGFTQENVSVKEILKEVKELHAIQISKNKAIIEEGYLPGFVWGNKGQISQLFQNLIENSIKFQSQETLTVFIKAEVYEGGFWHFSIKDNGIGIEEKYFKDVFVVFKRLHSRQNYQGSGIGLSLCQKIVELHDGKIWISANPEGGCTIHFTLPASQFASI